MNSEKLLEKSIEKLGTASAVAEFLGVGRAYISRIRGGAEDRSLTEMQCAQLAKLVDESPEIAWLEAAKERTSDEEERSLLGKLLKGFKTSGVALTIAASVALAGFSEKSHAGEVLENIESSYTMCTKKKGQIETIIVSPCSHNTHITL